MPTEKHFESFAEKQIREAMERGEFDDLPGAGKPLSGMSPVYDPEWWAKRFITREQVRDRADELRRTIRAELPRLRASSDVSVAQARVIDLNEMIAAVKSGAISKSPNWPFSFLLTFSTYILTMSELYWVFCPMQRNTIIPLYALLKKSALPDIS